jgi:hypothetical protein
VEVAWGFRKNLEASSFLCRPPWPSLPRRAEGSGGEVGVGRSRGEGTRGSGGLCSGGGRGSGRLGGRDLVFLVADSPFRLRSGGDFPPHLLSPARPCDARGGFPQDCPPARPRCGQRIGGARGGKLAAERARLDWSLVLEFRKPYGLGFAYLRSSGGRGSKSVSALDSHSDNDNPKFMAILDATEESESKRKMIR